MAAVITYEIVGNPNFLRDMSYNAHIPRFLKQFEDKFKLAEDVAIEFRETMNSNPNIPIENIIEVSEDGLRIRLNFIESRIHLGKGKVSDPPSTINFLNGFRFYMDNTVVKEDNERFDVLNVNK